MKTGLKYGINELKRINGNIKDDTETARFAVSEMEQLIKERVEIIDDYDDLKTILTGESLAEIKSILISIDHVMNSLQELQAFHVKGNLNDIFDVSLHEMSKLVELSKRKAKGLIANIDCEKS